MGISSVAQLTGVVFIVGYSSYFFELAGLSASNAFSASSAFQSSDSLVLSAPGS